MEGNGGFDAINHKLLQGALHPNNYFFSCLTAHDQLGDHGIVIRRDDISCVNVRIYPYTTASRDMQIQDFSWAWSETICWILRIDSAFHCKQLRVVISTRNGLARGYFYLFFDEVKVGYFLSDGMLYLNSGIHLHKIEVAVFVDQKLDGTCSFIANGFSSFDGSFAHCIPKFIRDKWRGSFFDKLLVSSLDRAITLR